MWLHGGSLIHDFFFVFRGYLWTNLVYVRILIEMSKCPLIPFHHVLAIEPTNCLGTVHEIRLGWRILNFL